MYRGEARASQVTGPSSSCVLWSNTPPDTRPSSPICRRGALLPSMESSTLGIRKDIGFGAAVPRPARSSAYASPAVSPRPAQGGLPARAGSPLAGQDSHLLDDKQSFMKASHPPIPFDPQGLVALNFLLCCRCCQAPLRMFFSRHSLGAVPHAPVGLATSFGVGTDCLQRPALRASSKTRHPMLSASFDNNWKVCRRRPHLSDGFFAGPGSLTGRLHQHHGQSLTQHHWRLRFELCPLW
jgi:hypothetical protein